MKRIVYYTLLVISIFLTSCNEEKMVFDANSPFSFSIYICDEGHNDILNEKTDNNICDTRITIVCENESINVSNPRHPEWDPMWPALDGSIPPIEASIPTKNPDIEYNPYTNIHCETPFYLSDRNLDFHIIIGPKKWEVKIIFSTEVYINGNLIKKSNRPTYQYFDIVLSDKDLRDIHEWTARQQEIN